MATTVSQDDVLHLAQLSNLSLSDDEITSMQADLAKIIDHINELQKLDTSGVEPTYQVIDLENVWREDEIGEPAATRERLLSLAPEQADEQIKVPKVL